MSKKSFELQALKREIQCLREEAKSDKEIYTELSAKYFDKKTIAVLITTVPTNEAIRKFSKWQMILVALMAIIVVLFIIQAATAFMNGGKPSRTITPLLVAATYGWLTYRIAMLDCIHYYLSLLVFIIFVIEQSDNGNLLIVCLWIAGGMQALVTLFLVPRLFPKFRAFGGLNKIDGEYVVD